MTEIVTIIDSGVLSCWLEIPGKNVAGSGQDRWDNARANMEIDFATQNRSSIILPNSVIVEVGRFIAQAPHSRRGKAEALLDRTIASLGGINPWKRFDESERIWTHEWYGEARQKWPDQAEAQLSLTDYSLVSIGKFLAETGVEARILTTDSQLRANFPMPAKVTARRPRR